MERILRLLLIAVIFAACIAAFGCSRTVVYKDSPEKTVEAGKPGPPPHAPAHGYRHKHPDGVVLIYESEIGVYVVSGYSLVYYHGAYFYRLHKNRWQTSRHIAGPWHKSNVKKLPQGLRQEVAEKKKGKGHNK
jgi:hypothetical protein